MALARKYPLKDESWRDVVMTASLGHDFGRVGQFRLSGNFSDNIVDGARDALNYMDHHWIGYALFPALVCVALKDEHNNQEIANLVEKDRDLKTIRAAMALHGCEMVLGKNSRATKIWNSLDEEQQEIVRIISKLDNAENAIGCLTYILMEQYEHSKSTEKSGFIENKDLCGVPDYYMAQYLSGKQLDRYDPAVPSSQKTYAGYLLGQLALGTSDPINHEIMKTTFDTVVPVFYYEDGRVTKNCSMTYLEGIEFVFRCLKTPENQIKKILEFIKK